MASSPREHEHGPVGRVGQRAGHQQLAALVGGLGQAEVLGSQGGAPLEVVVDELVQEQPVHAPIMGDWVRRSRA